MLSITPNAEQAIEAILGSSEAPAIGGVRIDSQEGSDEEEAGFQLAVVPAPAAEDEILAGGQVFVEPHTAALLSDSELDAEIGDGQVQFKLQHQAA